MVLDELRDDVNKAIRVYMKRYKTMTQIPVHRCADINYIREILKKNDAVLICHELDNYLDIIVSPFFSWLPFVDINIFVSLIKKVLQKDCYQELNILRRVLKEKEKIIAELNSPMSIVQGVKEVTIEGRLDDIVMDLKLLKSENLYLYQTIEQLENKITALVAENKNNLNRAFQAEQEVIRLNKCFLLDECKDAQAEKTGTNYCKVK